MSSDHKYCTQRVDSRLYYTLATGEITSKHGAGRYALDAFPPRWQRIVAECLRLRRGGDGRSLYRTPLARRREALASMDMAIDDALRLSHTGTSTGCLLS